MAADQSAFLHSATASRTSAGLTRLAVQNFRNYQECAFTVDAPQLVITGPNGIGKTNLLEAISLLAPGRGLRHATPQEWRRSGAEGMWGVAANFADGTQLGTRAFESGKAAQRRQVLHAGIPLTTQADLADYVAVVWLTPQMDGLFLDDAAARRKFFDRLIYAAHPEHAKHVQRYEYALRQRNKLLKDKASPSLIRALHPILVATGVAIAAARLDKTAQLNEAFDTMKTPFPLPYLQWQGTLEEKLQSMTALAVEDYFQAQLEETLEHDRMIGQTRLGIHRSDVATFHRIKNIPVSQCSTGEQKALLLALVLAHADWLGRIEPNRPLLLLLDEAVAHLDATRQTQLFAWVETLHAQVWFTGTDAAQFQSLQSAQHIRLPV